MQGRPVRIDPDVFFGKHAAILGSTGSGKSCTIASLLQSIREQQGVKRTTCVVLDTNGEYRTAFQKQTADGSWEGTGPGKALYIPSDPAKDSERLAIPYWFMNAEDFARLFQASKGVQRPVLLEALRLARNDAVNASPVSLLREELVHELGRIWSLSGKDEKTSKDVRDVAKGLKTRIGNNDMASAWVQAQSKYDLTMNDMETALDTVSSTAESLIDNGTYTKIIPADARKTIRDAIKPFYEKLTGTHLGGSLEITGRSADAPSHFDKLQFRSRHIKQVLRREEAGGARARDFSGTMLLRIDRLLDDRRFDFLFGPVGEVLPNPAHALATFLRDTLGIGASKDATLTNEADVPKSILPFYDRQRDKGDAVDVVILDLSLLAGRCWKT